MGLSVAIAGAIVLSVIMLVMMTLTGFVGTMFTIGDASTQISEVENTIDKTDISLETLFAQSGLATVNFTLNNDDQEKLWNFEKFNVIVEYEAGSGQLFEELTFSGDCLGVSPSAGNWCIEGISGDFLDKGILNEGESAEVFTQVSQNLVNQNARVTVSTDNGVVAKLPAPKRSWFDANPVPTAFCEFPTYGRTFIDTDTGIAYVCDPSRDKWLSVETIFLVGEEGGGCGDEEGPDFENNCSVDWGNGLGNDVSGGIPEVGLYIPYNMTLIAYGISIDDPTDCDSGASPNYDFEFWGTSSNNTDEGYALQAEIVGLTGEVNNDNQLDLDIIGDQYTFWGLENHCNEDINDFNVMLYLKWRHDNP